MMPLNFSSTKSQIILLLKYWTGSHCKENKYTGVISQFYTGERHEQLRTFQMAPESNTVFLSDCKPSFPPQFCFPNIPFEKQFFSTRAGHAMTHFQLYSRATGVFQTERQKESSAIYLLCRPLAPPFLIICALASRRCYKGESGSDGSGSYRYSFWLVLFLLRLQGQLDEELLQFFITIINTKLLKAANKKTRKIITHTVPQVKEAIIDG